MTLVACHWMVKAALLYKLTTALVMNRIAGMHTLRLISSHIHIWFKFHLIEQVYFSPLNHHSHSSSIKIFLC